MQLSTVNETEMGEKECSDALFLRYGLDPPNIPKYCDGCNAKFSICHTLGCKRGGLVTARHNDLRDGVTELTGKAFTPSHVRNNPLIFSGRVMKRTKATPVVDSGTTDQTGAPPPEVME